ncbi:uncharacterized protein K489DRAFT_244040 [Dissoconium aciculare CBS 342.82]|uniref:Uncharacterized protein n=1 Tax=Dissoconium aciculare CBS 342.82 TaxID=1314786 RepID=A0A6J3M6G4_9PEZI|nr:uncharacterized protein K489DRAFT_244040 [Dissoconium aciculare CBS 342.82]KAF1822467.1 hypothetical protein K489DRAFT_244040 [Dissoconium aciculare CBS 342.82]
MRLQALFTACPTLYRTVHALGGLDLRCGDVDVGGERKYPHDRGPCGLERSRRQQIECRQGQHRYGGRTGTIAGRMGHRYLSEGLRMECLHRPLDRRKRL